MSKKRQAGEVAADVVGAGRRGAAGTPGITSEPVDFEVLPEDAFVGEDEPDWDPSDFEELSEYEIAGEDEPNLDAPGSASPDADVDVSVRGPVSDRTPADILAAVKRAEANAGALPEYIDPNRQAWRIRSAELAEVQHVKTQEVEHVRYRAVAEYP